MKVTKKDVSLARNYFKTLREEAAKNNSRTKRTVSARALTTSPTPDKSGKALRSTVKKSLSHPVESSTKVAAVRSVQSQPVLVLSGSSQIPLPRVAVEALTKVLELIAEGKAVKISAEQSETDEVTTQQAADYLRVSRPFLINLLETGAIPFRKVGSHRRVLIGDLQKYKNQVDAKRLEALAELAAQAQELNMGY